MPSTHDLPPMDRINLVAIQNRLGMSTASKGEQYFQSSRVGPLNWYTDAALLTAAVRGNQRWPYESDLRTVMHNDRPVDLDFGKCSCPVGFDCKHVYAVLLQAVHDTSTKLQPAYSAPVVQHWSHSLSELRMPVDPLYTGAATQQFGIQLTLSAPADSPPYFRLSARPVKLSERGSWVTSGLSWDRFPHVYSAEAAEQIAVLREIHALSLVKSRRHNSYYLQPGSRVDPAVGDIRSFTVGSTRRRCRTRNCAGQLAQEPRPGHYFAICTVRHRCHSTPLHRAVGDGSHLHR